MIKDTYFYVVTVFDYESHSEYHYYHNEKYSHHEFSLLVQECIDEVVEEYSKIEKYDNSNPCSLDTYDIIKSPKFYRSMKNKGFLPVKTTTSFAIEETRVFSTEFGSKVLRERYSDLSLGECQDCFREDDDFDEECPVLNVRRK